MRGRFGTPEGIDASIARLPEAMQADGVRMLAEMGQTLWQIVGRTGLDLYTVQFLIKGRITPFRRGGEAATGERGAL